MDSSDRLENLRVLIVGREIGGLTLGGMLSKNGCHPDIVEGTSEWVQKQSWRIGKIARWESVVGCKLRALMMKWTPDSVSAQGIRKLLQQEI